MGAQRSKKGNYTWLLNYLYIWNIRPIKQSRKPYVFGIFGGGLGLAFLYSFKLK